MEITSTEIESLGFGIWYQLTQCKNGNNYPRTKNKVEGKTLTKRS